MHENVPLPASADLAATIYPFTPPSFFVEYNQACDWWSVGVILYEMLVGRPPFVAQTALDTQLRVVQWPRHLRIPGEPRLAADAADLMRRLLCDPEDRLADPRLMKRHAFFASVDWDKLPSQTPPYVPTVSSSRVFTYKD